MKQNPILLCGRILSLKKIPTRKGTVAAEGMILTKTGEEVFFLFPEVYASNKTLIEESLLMKSDVEMTGHAIPSDFPKERVIIGIETISYLR